MVHPDFRAVTSVMSISECEYQKIKRIFKGINSHQADENHYFTYFSAFSQSHATKKYIVIYQMKY